MDKKKFDSVIISEMPFVCKEFGNVKSIFNGNNFICLYIELKAGKAISRHIHENNDQYFIITKGEGKFLVQEEKRYVSKDTAIFIKAGIEHCLVNIGEDKLCYFEFLI